MHLTTKRSVPICTIYYVIMECIELSLLCKHMKKVRNNMAGQIYLRADFLGAHFICVPDWACQKKRARKIIVNVQV